MIKQEIIEKISKYFKLTDYEAEKVYDDIFSIIMTGVREDNIVDVANFGEFIIKYNNGKSNGNGSSSNGYKKTVEFLASTNMEEELNQTGFEEPKQISRETTIPPVVPPAHDVIEGSSVEEELRKKREEILSKITGPILPRPSILSSEPKKENTNYTPEPEKPVEPEKPEEPEKLGKQISAEEPVVEEPKAYEKPVEPETEQEVSQTAKETAEETTEEKTPEQEVEDISRRSFSDYFSEVTEETKPVIEQKPFEESKEDVIPKSAVLLHNEIMDSESKNRIIPEEPPKQQVQPVLEAVQKPERRGEDNSYYIWYKDSESNPTDTQTLSYEYELLYQASKEAEYKSKLKIYVTTFILFFSIVLLLLIFSPVIYKVFFTPEEIQNIENTQQESPGVTEQKGSPNVIQENTTTPQQTEEKTQTEKQTVPQQTEQKQQVTTTPLTQEEKKIQEQPKQQKSLEQAGNNQKTQQQEQIQPPPQTDKKLAGVSKNSMGWMDEKFKVIYIQLENGKFTIQESAWDTDAKANKRIKTVESFGIAGLNGNVIKAELGNKGTWYRVRFGEFSTIEEARLKAEELRNKERIKLQAMLVFLFLYA